MTHLIDKDALVAEIERRINEYWNDSENTMGIYPYALEEVIKYANTLEVKEVDLEKEIDDWYSTMGIPVTTDALKETAHHFFELGLKAQKGE